MHIQILAEVSDKIILVPGAVLIGVVMGALLLGLLQLPHWAVWTVVPAGFGLARFGYLCVMPDWDIRGYAVEEMGPYFLRQLMLGLYGPMLGMAGLGLWLRWWRRRTPEA